MAVNDSDLDVSTSTRLLGNDYTLLHMSDFNYSYLKFIIFGHPWDVSILYMKMSVPSVGVTKPHSQDLEDILPSDLQSVKLLRRSVCMFFATISICFRLTVYKISRPAVRPAAQAHLECTLLLSESNIISRMHLLILCSFSSLKRLWSPLPSVPLHGVTPGAPPLFQISGLTFCLNLTPPGPFRPHLTPLQELTCCVTTKAVIRGKSSSCWSILLASYTGRGDVEASLFARSSKSVCQSCFFRLEGIQSSRAAWMGLAKQEFGRRMLTFWQHYNLKGWEKVDYAGIRDLHERCIDKSDKLQLNQQVSMR